MQSIIIIKFLCILDGLVYDKDSGMFGQSSAAGRAGSDHSEAYSHEDPHTQKQLCPSQQFILDIKYE